MHNLMSYDPPAPHWADGAPQVTYSKLFLRFPVQFWDANTQFILQASDKGTAPAVRSRRAVMQHTACLLFEFRLHPPHLLMIYRRLLLQPKFRCANAMEVTSG
jgi:hypothetical protein